MKRYIYSTTSSDQAKTYVEEYTYQAWDNYNDDPKVNLSDIVNTIIRYIEDASADAEADGDGKALHLGTDFTRHDIRNEMRKYEWTVGKKSRKLTGATDTSKKFTAKDLLLTFPSSIKEHADYISNGDPLIIVYLSFDIVKHILQEQGGFAVASENSFWGGLTANMYKGDLRIKLYRYNDESDKSYIVLANTSKYKGE